MRSVRLGFGQELYGTFRNITIDEEMVSIEFSRHIIQYRRNTLEADFILEHLPKENVGKQIGIINDGMRLKIRWIGEKEFLGSRTRFMKWHTRTYGPFEGDDGRDC